MQCIYEINTNTEQHTDKKAYDQPVFSIIDFPFEDIIMTSQCPKHCEGDCDEEDTSFDGVMMSVHEGTGNNKIL